MVCRAMKNQYRNGADAGDIAIRAIAVIKQIAAARDHLVGDGGIG
ncbi:Uncharacterised protein [Salmonella enterica subsp. enterica serovar Bovismorbificans]|uniref:Uncharacterized protein n=1 Tax=Salmonella enterica subsp. enterica serovar Bovismorbificans TaxID=58097 RepID=A0A655DIZ7_SALET|nr:Uncharacterised protein [Salmonella enterica subsp. enterica serovar Bovismorbificans]